MTFHRYLQYRDSAVPWLGEIPGHWRTLPLKAIAAGPGETFIDGDWIESRHLAESGVRYITTGNIGIGVYKEQGSGYISDDTFDELNCTAVEPGDVLISRLNAPIGRACIAPKLNSRVVTSVDNVIVRPGPKIDRRYLVFRLSSPDYLHEAGTIASGATMQRISRTELAQIRIAFPPFEEQTVIASFLDQQTAKIDSLIAEQEKLITLLAEKRQATISHAVIRGLNPHVPLKNSGVGWMGDVPEHWEVMTFQRCVYIQEGLVNPEDEPFRSMILIAPNHIESGTGRLLYSETAEEQSAESGKYLCKANDVIYSKIRPALRKVCIAPTDCLCSADMYPMRGTSGLSNAFLMWFMLSEPFAALAVLESERVAMPKINRESLKAVWVPVPKPQEQAEINEFLVQETGKLDALVDQARKLVELLSERRAALIAAAVTGQIDVRGTIRDTGA